MKRKKYYTNLDELKVGPCQVVIRNKYSGADRIAEGEVALVPYKKDATKETKAKYGKNLVYVIYKSYEFIVGYYQ